MIYRSAALLFLCSTLALSGMSQEEITPADKVEISYKAKLMLQEFESLLNVITNNSISTVETELLINNSFTQSSNQLFINSEAIVEDDIDPKHTAAELPLDVPVKQYLKDLDIFYKKSEDPSITFSNYKTSAVLKKEYLFVRVLYDCKFTNGHRELKIPYKLNKRIAEVKATKKGGQWDTKIVSVTFYDPNEEFEAKEYKLESTRKLAPATNLVASSSADSAAIALEEERMRAKMEALEQKKLEEEIEKRMQKFNNERASAYQNAIERGDRLTKEGEFQKALAAYEEANEVEPYGVYPLTRIKQLKQQIQDRSQMKARVFSQNIKKASTYRLIRNYPLAIEHYRKAAEIRPNLDSIQQRIRELSKYEAELQRNLINYKNGNYSNAVKDLNRAIKNQSGNPDLYFWRAMAYSQDGKAKRAFSDFGEAIKRFKNYYGAYVQRAELYSKESNADQAIADYTMALAIYDQDPNSYIQRAVLHDQKGRKREAIQDYSSAIDIAPETSGYYLSRGKLWREQRNYDQALSDFTQAVTHAPDDPQTWYYRGLVYLDKKQIIEAASDFEEARQRKLDGTSRNHIQQLANQFYNQGQTAMTQQDYVLAVDNFTSSLRIQPNYADAWFARGQARSQQNDQLGAIDDFSETLRIAPQRYMAYFLRGEARLKRKELKMAVEDFDQAARLNPAYLQAFIKAGDTHAELRQFPNAIQAYEGALTQNEEQPIIHFKKGFLQLELKEANAAITSFSNALKFQKQFPEAYYHRGLAYIHAGDATKAKSDFSNAIKQKPDYADAYFELGNAYQFSDNNHKKALIEYGNAIRNQQGFVEAHLNRGKAHYTLLSYGAAASDFNQVLALNPNFTKTAQFCEMMGFSLLHNRKAAEAKDYFEQAKNLNDNPRGQGSILYGLAFCEFKGGNKEKGYELLEAAFKTGGLDGKKVKKDSLVASIKKDSQFKSLARKYLK